MSSHQTRRASAESGSFNLSVRQPHPRETSEA